MDLLLDRSADNRAPIYTALVACIGVALMTPALALECPQPQMKASKGALKETPNTISMRSATLKARGSAAVPSLIFQIRKDHPGSSNADVTDYLITAYCPVVNQRHELTEDQKKQDLARFADQVRSQLP